ncbi:MAG: OmpH family outer membrane protein [Pseudomonadota bacterium]
MKTFTKTLAAAGLAACAIATAMPASAQVSGKVATSSVSRALLNTTALQAAFNQVGTTYKAQLDTAQAKQTELSAILKPFDLNSNGSIDAAEKPALEAAPNYVQVQTLQAEIDAIEQQVNAAQVYAVDQVLSQYNPAVTEVAQAQQIVMVVDPGSIQFAGEGADITALVTTSLNTKVPSVGIVPPANWRPRQESIQVYQDIQRRILLQQIALQRQQQAAQQQQPQGNAQAPAGR